MSNINMNWKPSKNRNISGLRMLLQYGYTPNTPGRYFEDALKASGVVVDRKDQGVHYDLGMWVESPSRPMVSINYDRLPRPFVCWIHHGQNRLIRNQAIIGKIKPDYILMSHSLHLAPKLDGNVSFFPFGWDPIYNNGGIKWADRQYLVGFVGSGMRVSDYSRRRQCVATAAATAKQLKSKSIITQHVFREAMAAIYRDCKIVLNPVHNTIKSVNMRIWEAMGCGALVLSHRAPEQESLFVDGVHYLLFDTPQELVNKMNWVRANSMKAANIAANGNRLVMTQHAYTHRVQLLFDLLAKIGFDLEVKA